MDKPEEEPTPKVNIFTQPIFLLAVLLIVFNVLLYFWSASRESKQAEASGKPAPGQVEESK